MRLQMDRNNSRQLKVAYGNLVQPAALDAGNAPVSALVDARSEYMAGIHRRLTSSQISFLPPDISFTSPGIDLVGERIRTGAG